MDNLARIKSLYNSVAKRIYLLFHNSSKIQQSIIYMFQCVSCNIYFLFKDKSPIKNVFCVAANFTSIIYETHTKNAHTEYEFEQAIVCTIKKITWNEKKYSIEGHCEQQLVSRIIFYR